MGPTILYLKLKKQKENIRIERIENMQEFALATFTQIVEIALPVAVVFELGNLIVGTILRAAFGGKLWVGK